MELFLKQFSVLIPGKFKQHPSGGWLCQSVSVSVCLYPSLQAPVAVAAEQQPRMPSSACSKLQDPAPLWHWLGLTQTSTYTPFSALDTRVVWQKLKIKRLGLGCGQFFSFPALRSARGREGSSAFCTTRIKVSQNCCESTAGATQSTWWAGKKAFPPRNNHLQVRRGWGMLGHCPQRTSRAFSWPRPDASSSWASGLLENFPSKLSGEVSDSLENVSMFFISFC